MNQPNISGVSSMLNVEVFHDVVMSAAKDSSPSGISCYFVKINDELGIKVYRNEEERDNAFNRQSKMAERGYAPPVGIRFEIEDKYCYVTEIAEVICERDRANKETIHEWYDRCFDYKMKHPLYQEELNILLENMETAGFRMDDVHMGNFGRFNDKLVCIDFGDI